MSQLIQSERDAFFKRTFGVTGDKPFTERRYTSLASWTLDGRPIHAEYRTDLRVPGGAGVNQSLEKAGRVDDFFELAALMCRDALHRNESCGGHFRAEYQTEEGEALRDDDQHSLWRIGWAASPVHSHAPT